MMSHFNINSPQQLTYEIKRSKFIACAHNANSREQAMQALQMQKQAYPDARHHCWAYLLGSPFQPISMAMSDDGEPSGTAGKPILNVLQHNDVGNIMLIVVRYFGGIKLGAGGLVRAYSHATQALLDKVEKTPYIEMTQLKVNCEFAKEQYIRHLANQFNGEVINCDYQQSVRVTISLPANKLKAFKQSLPK